MRNRLLILLILQVIPLILFPPKLLANGLPILGVLAVLYILLGWAIMRGRGWALTLCIFLQGLNVIVRIMMFFPNMVNRAGEIDVVYAMVSLVAIVLSIWFVFRLDQADIRSQIVA